MPNHDDLLKAIGVPLHEEKDLGTFFMALGTWRHTCTVDFPFQSDVQMIFDLGVKRDTLPDSMLRNVRWIQDHLEEIWNAAALAINGMVESQQIEMPGEFAVDSVCAELPDGPVDTGCWTLEVEPSGLEASFVVTFEGLTPIGQRYA
jgi:hypothetical protein